jgi:hypothetical protein
MRRETICPDPIKPWQPCNLSSVHGFSNPAATDTILLTLLLCVLCCKICPVSLHCILFPPFSPQALLGPSGAGKSTLMDILAQRKSMGNLSGFLLVDGQPATSSFIRKTAYVPQVRPGNTMNSRN